MMAELVYGFTAGGATDEQLWEGCDCLRVGFGRLAEKYGARSVREIVSGKPDRQGMVQDSRFNYLWRHRSISLSVGDDRLSCVYVDQSISPVEVGTLSFYLLALAFFPGFKLYVSRDILTCDASNLDKPLGYARVMKEAVEWLRGAAGIETGMLIGPSQGCEVVLIPVIRNPGYLATKPAIIAGFAGLGSTRVEEYCGA